MARNIGTSVENAFNKGLVTEVTGVNSPESSVVETLNVIYDRRGRAVKRKGFKLEDGYVSSSVPRLGVYSEYVWYIVSSSGNNDMVVIQSGSTIHFYSMSTSGSLSSNKKSFTINLLDFKSSEFTDTDVRNSIVSYTSGRGALYIAHPYCSTIYVKYDKNTDSITTEAISVKIRDFKGLPEVYAVDERPTTLTDSHKYNLFNQGWYATATTNSGTQNVLTAWDAAMPNYPSNKDVWWHYLYESGGVEQFRAVQSYLEGQSEFYGNTPAAKGHYIIDAYKSNRTTLSGITGINEYDSSGLRPSAIAFYAGRIFYAGVNKPGFSSLVYFSQIIESDDQIGKCYQVNDPTSRESYDLLDTDGGVVDIQDINTIYDLRVVGQVLYVFASNGVWAISGSDKVSFKASDYTVSKITSFPAVSRLSIVDVGGFPVWWNYEGIFTLKTSNAGLTTDVTSLSTNTIQTYFDEIPHSSKAYAKGEYNDQDGIIYWLFSSDEEDPTAYDRLLVLDAVSLAFYPLSVPQDTKEIVGVVTARKNDPIFIEDPVLVGTDPVLVGVTPVTSRLISSYQLSDKVFKFVTVTDNTLTFSEISDESYLDWGGLSYENFFVTGYRIRGQLISKSQTNYLIVILDSVINSSCFLQAVWDYSNDNRSGRYGNPQQVYRNVPYKDYQRSRLMVRGNGHSLQFKFYGEDGKPFSITGWAGFETSDGGP